jgi:transcriptional regulator with XRE-family HTH domain
MATRDSVPDKIDYLFKTIRRPDGREHTYDEVEHGTGGAVSRSYIWKLRHGRNRNPSLEVISALGRFFDVPVAYFFDEKLNPEESAEVVAIAGLIRNPDVRRLAEQAAGLTPDQLALLTEMAARLKRLPS